MTTTSSVEVSYSVTSAGTMVPSEKGDWKIFIMMKMLRSPFQPKGLKWVENKETETFKVTCERFEFFETAELDTFLIANNWERLGLSHQPIYQPKSKTPPRDVRAELKDPTASDEENEQEWETHKAKMEEWKKTHGFYECNFLSSFVLFEKC